jgi:NADPH:quinone reductase-like Zn-dependent oxidoreductase
MKAWEIRGQFGLEHLSLQERPEPVCGPDQIVVEIAAVSLNYRDLMVVRGTYNPRQPLPLIPVSDGCGRVIEVGTEVESFEPGDRVGGVFAQGWLHGAPTRAGVRQTLGGPLDGMLAERVVLPASGAVAIPEHLDWVGAATLPCAGVTAWNALFTEGGLEPGQTVLLLGTGGVSIFALQFAKAAGARVIITSSSDQKLQRARAMGADEVVNYTTEPEWGRVAGKMTAEGVDLVVEVGGAATLAQSLRAVRVGGRISLIGILSGNRHEIELSRIFMNHIRVQGILVGSREQVIEMTDAIAGWKLQPVCDRVFEFEDVPQAFAYLDSGAHFGKVCISLRP